MSHHEGSPLPGTPRPHHPILHRHPFTPARFGRPDLVFGGLAQGSKEWSLLVRQDIVSCLCRAPAAALGCKEVVGTLLLVDAAHAGSPVITEECTHDERRVLRRDDETANVRSERNKRCRRLALYGVLGALAWKTNVDKGGHRLHYLSVLAVFNEVLHAVLVVRIPAGWVDATKLAIIQDALRFGVDYALNGTVLTPIGGAFSLSFDKS